MIGIFRLVMHLVWISGQGSAQKASYSVGEAVRSGGIRLQRFITCKFTTPGSSAGQTDVLWVAKGFGIIRTELEDAQGVIVAGSGVELATIVSAP